MTIQNYVENFFSQFGFGDGDNIPSDAWTVQEEFIELLNQNLSHAEAKASSVDWGFHNSCAIEIKLANGVVYHDPQYFKGTDEEKEWIEDVIYRAVKLHEQKYAGDKRVISLMISLPKNADVEDLVSVIGYNLPIGCEIVGW